MTTPTSKALEEAVERAAVALLSVEEEAPEWAAGFLPWAAEQEHTGDCTHALPELRGPIGCSRCVYDRTVASAKAILSAAFPGLFNGTMWLAPWEATEEMIAESDVASNDWYTGAKWSAMRDAYLNAERKE